MKLMMMNTGYGWMPSTPTEWFINIILFLILAAVVKRVSGI